MSTALGYHKPWVEYDHAGKDWRVYCSTGSCRRGDAPTIIAMCGEGIGGRSKARTAAHAHASTKDAA